MNTSLIMVFVTPLVSAACITVDATNTGHSVPQQPLLEETPTGFAWPDITVLRRRVTIWETKVFDRFEEGSVWWVGFDERIGDTYHPSDPTHTGLHGAPGESQRGQVERVDMGEDAFADHENGSFGMRVAANDAGAPVATPNNHLIAYRRVCDAFADGFWRYRFAARIPALRNESRMPGEFLPVGDSVPKVDKGRITDVGQTGPEFSLQNSRFENREGQSQLISYICGMQYVATPFAGAALPQGSWKIYIEADTGPSPRWVKSPFSLVLDRDRWYHFEFTVNFDTMRYDRFVIRTDAVDGAVLANWDLSDFAGPGHNKWTDPPLQAKFEISLEVEDLWSAADDPATEENEAQPDRYEVVHDRVHLARRRFEWVLIGIRTGELIWDPWPVLEIHEVPYPPREWTPPKIGPPIIPRVLIEAPR